MARAKFSAPSCPSTATIGFETKLWLAADKLGSNIDAAVTDRSGKRRQQLEPCKHFIHCIRRSLGERGHLAAGNAGFVFANGLAAAGSSNQRGADYIRRTLIEADLVDDMLALPASSSGCLQ